MEWDEVFFSLNGKLFLEKFFSMKIPLNELNEFSITFKQQLKKEYDLYYCGGGQARVVFLHL